MDGQAGILPPCNAMTAYVVVSPLEFLESLRSSLSCLSSSSCATWMVNVVHRPPLETSIYVVSRSSWSSCIEFFLNIRGSCHNSSADSPARCKSHDTMKKLVQGCASNTARHASSGTCSVLFNAPASAKLGHSWLIRFGSPKAIGPVPNRVMSRGR